MTTQETPDYTSRVPKYRFADTLEEQEAQLQTNPLMQRLLEYRQRYEGDPYRPIYHYVNPENTLNDPNGLCFWQGRFWQGRLRRTRAFGPLLLGVTGYWKTSCIQ